MPDARAVVALGVVLATRRSTRVTRIVPVAALAPLDANLETFQVQTIELVHGIFSVLLLFILNECIRALYKKQNRSQHFDFRKSELSYDLTNLSHHFLATYPKSEALT